MAVLVINKGAGTLKKLRQGRRPRDGHRRRRSWRRHSKSSHPHLLLARLSQATLPYSIFALSTNSSLTLACWLKSSNRTRVPLWRKRENEEGKKICKRTPFHSLVGWQKVLEDWLPHTRHHLESRHEQTLGQTGWRPKYTFNHDVHFYHHHQQQQSLDCQLVEKPEKRQILYSSWSANLRQLVVEF